MSGMSIEALNLRYSYRAREVLKGVSFTVRQGETLFVLGPNGAGKSTLFKCVLGLLRDYGGSVRVDGRDLRKYHPAQLARVFAYIPQSHHPRFDYTALEIVLMGTTPRIGAFSVPGNRQRAEAMRALALLGIDGLRGRRFGGLSGGEQQLVLIARAIAQDAGTIVMDEPTANLDYGHQVLVLDQIRRLSGKGYSILLSSHDPGHAFLYADRVLAMKDGHLAGAGDPREVLTESLLHSLYGVPVKLYDCSSGRSLARVCVPQTGGRENERLILGISPTN